MTTCFPTNRRLFLSSTITGLSLLPATSQAEARFDRKIRIGQIGVAHGHATKISVYRQSDDYEVIGIVEPDDNLREKAQSHAAFRDLPWMSQEELLNRSDLQAVLVETTPRDCLDVAQACIAAGKHVHLDKPAGQSLPQFELLLAEAEKKKLLIQMGYMYRYNPAIVLLRDFLAKGWLGDVFEVHAVMSKVVDRSSRAELAGYPGGILFELGCHLVDLVVGILGEPAAVRSFGRKTLAEHDALQDNVLAVLDYPKAIASVKSSALEVEGFGRRHLVVCGTEGTFHIQPLDDPAVRLALSAPKGSYRAGYQDVVVGKYARYIDDATDMAKILRGEKESDFSTQHDLSVQRTLLKACIL